MNVTIKPMRARMRIDQVPVPQPLATTTRRAYAEAAGFFALALGTFSVTAILDGAAASGFHPGWSVFAYRWEPMAQWYSLAAMTIWLAAIHQCRLTWACVAGLTASISGYAILASDRMRTPDGTYEVASAATGALLAVMLARRRYVSLPEFGIGRGWGRRDYYGRTQANRVFWWAVAANVASAFVGALIRAVGLPCGHSPIQTGESVVGVVLRMLASGVIEEVMVAVVVIALSAARRPAWEMYATSTAMRVSYHLYYQTAGLSVIAMGLANVWLYRRSRRLTPIMIGHTVYDLLTLSTLFGRAYAFVACVIIYGTTALLAHYWARSDREGRTPNTHTKNPPHAPIPEGVKRGEA